MRMRAAKPNCPASLAATRGRTRRRRRPTPANDDHQGLANDVPRPCTLGNAGDGKRERGARSVIRFAPQTTMMLSTDRAADRQTDAHATALGRVERIKQLVHAVGLDANADIPHRHAHTIAAVTFGPDE